MGRKGWGPAGYHLAVVLGYTLLSLVITWPAVRHFTDAIPGDGFDGWQNYWNLWWVKLALVDRHTHPYTTDLLYHPTGVRLYFHTLNPINALLSMPVQLAWGLFPAYNLAWLLAFVLGGYGTYLLVRYVTRRATAGLSPSACHGLAFLAGVVFTFSPYHLAHLLGHMQLVAVEGLPLYVLALLRLRERAPRGQRFPWRQVFLLVGFMLLVVLADWYYALYALIFTLATVAWVIVRTVRRPSAPHRSPSTAHLWRFFLPLTAAGILTILLLSPLLLTMVREALSLSYMVPPRDEVVALSADLLAFVTPFEMHTLWGPQAREFGNRFTANSTERTIFAGYIPLMLAFLAWLRGRPRRMVSFWSLQVLLFTLLALGPVLHVGGQVVTFPDGRPVLLPYALIADLPFINIHRSVSRFDVMVMLGLAVLAALGGTVLLRRVRHPLLPLVLSLLVLLEFLPVPYPVSHPDTPGWYYDLAYLPGRGAVLNLPMNWDRPGYLLYQTVHRRPLTAGYISRTDPRTLVDRAPVLQNFRHLGPDVLDVDIAQVAFSVLTFADVDFVVVDRYKMPGGPERTITEDQVRAIFARVPPVYADDRLTVYPVPRPGVMTPFPLLGEWGWSSMRYEGDTPWRTAADGAEVQVVTGGLTPVRVHLVVRGPEGARVRLLLGSEVVGVARLGPAPTRLVTDVLPLPAGVFPLTLRLEGTTAVDVTGVHVQPVISV